MEVLNILIVNINNLEYTKNLIDDLLCQTVRPKIFLVDQGSTEEGTREYLYSLDNIYVIRNDHNVSLSRIWNNFYTMTDGGYLCFLNNDIRVPDNFVKDTMMTFEMDKSIGCVVHATNNPEYKKRDDLVYVVNVDQFCQGWDFSIRREAYTIIPDEITFFGGDDFIYHNLYEEKWGVATVLSSPIIHFHAKSRKEFKGDRDADLVHLRKYVKNKFNYYNKYSRRKYD